MSKKDRYNDYDTEDYTPRRRRRNNSNTNSEASRKKAKKSSPAKKFFTIIVAVFCVYIAALSIYALISGEKPIEAITTAIGVKVPERTNFLLMCTDEDGTRTDTIMLGCYNSEVNKLDIISIPRDTLVTVSALNYEKMQEEYPQPSHRQMQINHIHHFMGSEKGPKVLTEEIESWLDINIDYYARVDFEAFRYFVDSIGGVEFNVPQDMDYDDPGQDLSIHLEAGTQMLDGDKAEQLVRFRKDNYGGGYANGDIGRISVQQDFFKALVKKALSSDTIKSNPKAYLTTFFNYVTTNASVTDAVKYISVLNKFDTENINTYTLPGKAQNKYRYDEEETNRLVYEIFKRPSEEILAEQTAAENGTAPTDSKSAKIQVLNGSYTNGKAGEVQELLNGEGYNVTDIDTYNDTKTPETRIYVNTTGLGDDLLQYFNNAEVIKDSQFTGEFDIVIVVGTDED